MTIARLLLFGCCLLLVSGCERYRLSYADPVTEAGIVRQNRILAAQIRRAQIVAEIARLNHVLRVTRTVENRIVLENLLDERELELERLDAIILRGLD